MVYDIFSWQGKCLVQNAELEKHVAAADGGGAGSGGASMGTALDEVMDSAIFDERIHSTPQTIHDWRRRDPPKKQLIILPLCRLLNVGCHWQLFQSGVARGRKQISAYCQGTLPGVVTGDLLESTWMGAHCRS